MPTKFTDEQLEAIHFLPEESSSKRHLVIEAGAGAGKTSVLGERVYWLLNKSPIVARLNPNQIFLVTFTNDAQNELKERLQNVLPLEQNNFVHVSTIDSLFDSLVESLYPLWWDNNVVKMTNTAMPPLLTLVTEKEVQRNLEKKVYHFLNHNENNSKNLALIIDFILSGGFKNNSSNLNPSKNTLDNILKYMCQDHFLTSSKESIRIASQKIHPATQFLIEKIHTIAKQEYEKRILKGEFTYADKTVFLKENLKNNCPISLKELIVDEYQDTNQLQHQILCQLVQNAKARMVVVGDPKQSIYGFRGASVGVFKSLLSHKNWHRIVLNKNFRTHENLLNEVNKLSKISFSWQNPKYPLNYINSFFYEEAQKKYISENPLVAGIPSQQTNSPCVSIISATIPPKVKLKINEYAPLVYGDFLKEFKIKQQINWSDIVVLCEKNKQIQILHDAFVQLGIPVKSLEQKESKEHEKFENHVALALVKALAGKANMLDFYLIFKSPFVLAPEYEIHNYFTKLELAAPEEAGIFHVFKFLNLLAKFQKTAKHNFFLAWQQFRWTLAFEKDENAKIFCANMDSFSVALEKELLNSNTRIELENSINTLGEFVLSNKLASYSLEQQIPITQDEADAIEIKTIHKAKGLEWPYVCFYPKYGLQMRTGEFIAAQSENFIDISWLNQDVESLSVVERIENAQFDFQDSFCDEEKKKVRFAELRKEQEENQERQRVFYTAFTRPQKGLILFQPASHHSSKKGLKEASIEKHNTPYSDYLEQDFLKKYINANFQFQSLPKNEQPPIKETFYSEKNTVEFIHYNVDEFSKNFVPCQTSKTGHDESNNCNFSPSIFKINSEENSHLKFQRNIDFEYSEKLIEQKREQKYKIHKGIIAHAGLENKKYNSNSFLYKLEQQSIICKKEFEIWSQSEAKSKRNILDMLILIYKKDLIEIFPKIQDILNLKAHIIALIIDFKTGDFQEEHILQIQNYSHLLKKFFEENPIQEEGIKNGLHQNFDRLPQIAVLGSLIYTKSTSEKNLSFNSSLLISICSNQQETFALVHENPENLPKNRHLLLTSLEKEVTI